MKRLEPTFRMPLVAALLALSGCTAVGRSPPLNARLAEDRPAFDLVHLTSGTFARPHEVLGVLQARQKGYSWMHELELVRAATPEGMLFELAAAAHDAGADGIERLSIIDENPEAPGTKTARQVSTAFEVMADILQGQPPAAHLASGRRTIYSISGELVRFTTNGEGKRCVQ